VAAKELEEVLERILFSEANLVSICQLELINIRKRPAQCLISGKYNTIRT
jgi:hypothetical protein